MNYVRAAADFTIRSASVRCCGCNCSAFGFFAECFSNILSYRQDGTSNLVKKVKINMRLSRK